MGKFSTYKYFELKDGSSITTTAHSQSRSRPAKSVLNLKKIFACLLLFGLFGVYIVGFFPAYLGSKTRLLDKIANTFGYHNRHYYAVVIDAGSSGTRVLAYNFRVPFTVFSEAKPEFVDELFAQSKPGLSAFADRPKEGAQTVVELIKKAEQLVPAEHRASSPLIVRATAGLRLLPEEKAKRLIEEVADAVSKLGYDTSPGVEIMDGADEGIYIWYTVNLLLKTIDTKNSMAALDLGGGSTQVTCKLNELDVPEFPAKDLYVISQGTNITLYTHSYLNLGLLAARHGIFKTEASGNADVIESSCVDPIVSNETWTYANKEYTVSGKQRSDKITRKQAFNLCFDVVKKYVFKTAGKTYRPKGPIAVMSYFYDVAVDAGIIGGEEQAIVSLNNYWKAAEYACGSSNIEQPWACVDLVYIVSLLHNVYSIERSENITLLKKVDGHEVSWALGIAYSTVLKNIEREVAKAAQLK